MTKTKIIKLPQHLTQTEIKIRSLPYSREHEIVGSKDSSGTIIHAVAIVFTFHTPVLLYYLVSALVPSPLCVAYGIVVMKRYIISKISLLINSLRFSILYFI